MPFRRPSQPFDGLCMKAAKQVNDIMSVVDSEMTKVLLKIYLVEYVACQESKKIADMGSTCSIMVFCNIRKNMLRTGTRKRSLASQHTPLKIHYYRYTQIHFFKNKLSLNFDDSMAPTTYFPFLCMCCTTGDYAH